MKRLFIVSLLLFCCTYTAEVFAQKRSGNSQNPLNYPYYIYGEQQIKGLKLSNLKNIKYKGFKSTNTKKSLPDSLRNTEHENISPNLVKGLGDEIYEKFLYEFEEISTIPEVSLANKRMQYWYQDENGEWWSDVEAGNGIANDRTDKETIFILVLDCSKSLEDDFKEVQAGAWSFIEDMYEYSNPNIGNIKIGIMYFSSMRNTEFFPITPLTHSNKEKIYNFMYGRHNDTKATAMYYAVNKGLDALYEYDNEKMQNIPAELYGGTHIITFTDGLDNTSQLEEQNLYTVSEVKRFVENRVHTTKIKNDTIVSWVIGAQGGDVQDEQLEKMKSQLKTLASTENHFIWMKKMSECIGIFKNLAKNCSRQWQNLSCTSSLSHTGPVCWTLGEVIKPKAEKEMLLGVNIGLGTDDCFDFNFTVGVDFAYPFTSKFGFGGYFSLGYDYEFCAKVGALATIGDYNKKKVKFLCGIGGHFGELGGLDLRFGPMFRNGLYLFANPYIGSSVNDGYLGGGFTINIGYNLGKLFKK